MQDIFQRGRNTFTRILHFITFISIIVQPDDKTYINSINSKYGKKTLLLAGALSLTNFSAFE